MTTIIEHSRTNQRRGFSLVEVLISTAVMSFFVAIATSSIVSLSRSSTAMVNYQSMNQESRFMLEQFARDLRSTVDVHNISVTDLNITTLTSDGTQMEITYTYNAAASVVYRQAAGAAREIVLRDVAAFDLQFFTFRGASTNSPLETKRVQLETILERNALSTQNTNHIISAQFVLRNHRVSS